MRVCKKCLNTGDHPYGLTFNSKNICMGCITNLETRNFDVSKLVELCDGIKAAGQNCTYDCIIPVRGDADDYHVVSTLLKYKLRPLLVGVNSYFYNDIGWTNLQNLQTHFDLDMEFLHPDARKYKDLVRYSFAKYDDIYIPFQFLFHSFVKEVALRKNIKYIVYGENQPTEQTGNFSNFDYPEKSQWFHENFDFRNLTLKEFLGTGANWGEADLGMYRYSNHKGQYPRGVFLSNYVQWDSMLVNHKIREFGFIAQKQSRTYDCFHRAGFSHFYEIHDFLRLKRHGYIKVRDHLCRDIRMGHITKIEAEDLYDYYLGIPYEFESFFNWLGVDTIGQEWLSLHKIKSSSMRCSTAPELNRSLELYYKGSEPMQSYLSFYKGVYID